MGLLMRLFKGFLYGNVIGIFFGTVIYLLASSVHGLGFISITPTALGGIIYAAGVTGGVGMEYSRWMDEQEKHG